jgi:copper homeostasis protein
MKIEVVVYNIDSALKALDGGADRIEVCADPAAGGTTPSYGTVEIIRQNVSLDVYAMIRPRGGDFLYNNYEFHSMKRDLSQFQRLSVDGVVFGILNADGTIDKKRCSELIARARPLKVTCHRAFDMANDPFQALEDCIEAGFDRILTSGQRTVAIEGAALVSELNKRAGDRIIVVAGSGINETNVRALVEATKVREIHFSATTYRESPMQFKNEKLSSMGSEGGNEFRLRSVDPEKIRAIRSLAENAIRDQNPQ